MKTYYDIVGDGGSKILEQVGEHKEQLSRALAGVRRILAVGSGKGGVGKSTLTRQLALALAPGRRIAILDADLNGPTQARLAGLQAAPWVPTDGRLAIPQGEGGVGVVSVGGQIPESQTVEFAESPEGDSHIWRATREFTFLGQLMSVVDWGELDFLIVDLPPGAERTFQYAGFLGSDADFILVTIPTELSHGVVSRSIAALEKTPNRLLGYVENMAGYACPGCDEVRPLFPAGGAADFDIPCLGRVPFDPALAATGAGSYRPATLEAVGQIAEQLTAAPAVEEDRS